ncbi:MAG: NAD(P)-dependent oxidoreductase [Syntrophobacteraceae bacterium]|jgi:dTDP-4-dehydrorhamnose reductase|nr:NAD(P)-dependent oxidoreductase [Syntrophobacteraceae bacterium]
MRRLLITGAGGFLGWNLCRELAESWEVVGTIRSAPVDLDSVRSVALDLTDLARLRQVFREVRPEGVIHAAAASRPDYCQLHPSESARVNVDVPILLAGLCADAGIPLVFTSSDLVFDGRNPPYREEDPVSPVSVYGEQKAKAEAEILRRHPSAAVCRMALMFGDGGPGGASFLQPMVRSMRGGKALKLFVDEVRTPVGGRDAAMGLALALESASGLLHLGGAERISRYDLGRLIADVLGIGEAVLIPSRQDEVSTPAPRPPDVSLDSSKARRLGFHPKPLHEALRDLRAVL